ncbi:putative ATPase/signal transduction histidine kinase [Variovorax boronicumulans]|uniref:trifunctional serine/threonine-protein kinase/ATP-binding protein/sensor histidine kinase n=1 Tax=Variovorax boronicumulans TaxID=436515 RepID=UPI002476AE9F|nr:ATP-binding sensor histidine kinase [Variovorax boronicumulans]MDH6170769.1 putative ATPase/signal transduction histidine kinase [Variovorax boronicumulans]
MRQENSSEHCQVETLDGILCFDGAEAEPARSGLENGHAVQETVERQFSSAGLLSREFRDLGTGTPRLERAGARGLASWLIAGRGQVAPTTLATLQREYAFRDALHEDWAAVPISLMAHGEGTLLVLKDPGGELLRRAGSPVRGTEAFIALALRLTAAVGAMHAAGVMHRALTPDRVLVAPDAGTYLTGFGYAARLASASAAPPEGNLAWDEDSFAYMAPELGARMNLCVDARADLYSLGCILYELLTGRPPFQGADAAELVHAHATQKPSLPGELQEGVPAQLSLLVLKLLEKTPDHRYGEAASVLADLRRCEALQRQQGCIPLFALDARAVLHRLLRTQQVLGRNAELQALVALYREVADGARARVAWVSGPSGIGKSILLREAVARIQQSGTPLLAAVKSEEGSLGRPYTVLVQTLEQLLQFVLGCPEAEFVIWQDRIRAATTAVDRTLAGFLPSLALVLGPQPEASEAPDTAPALERERVLQGMARLLACFATTARPLVLLLDDLQWADAGTLQVLERLLHQHPDNALLLVGAFRTREVGPDHPLRAGRLAHVPASVTMELGPLDESALRELIARALQQDTVALGPLAEVIGRKTERNPFFTQHLLGLLADEGLLAYDAQTAAWNWNLERIVAHPGVDNVVDLLARRFEQLPSPTQFVLRVLSCLGHRASGEELAISTKLPPGADALRSLEATLEPALQAGNVSREDGNWVFCHDRFREAAYASIPPEDRAPLHLEIARRQIAHPAMSAQVFAIAAQANLARSVISAPHERRNFAKLNLEAGRQAKVATAHHSALGFFRAALDLLGEDDTSHDGLAARALCGEAEFMTGALEVAEARLSALERVAGDGIFGADLARLRAALYTTLSRFDLALGVGLEFMRKSGIHVPMQPDEAAVDHEYAQLQTWLERHGMQAFRSLPIATDPLRRAIINIFADLIPPALYTDQNLVDLILLRMANLAIMHGHTDASANGYVCMTQVFGVRYGDYTAAREFGALALHLVDERGLVGYRGRVYMAFGTMVVPWTQPARAARDYIRRAYKVLVETADHTFAIYCAPNEASGMLFAGKFLGDVRDTVERGLAIARDANFQFVVDALLSQKLVLARLQDGTRGDPGAQPSLPQEDAPPTLVDFEYWVYRLQGCLLCGEIPEALEARSRAEACASAGRTFAESGELPYYGALTLLALPARDADQQAALQRDVNQLAAWADACPDNFLARFDLVRAELARVGGQPLEASEAYARAVSHARRNGFTQVEALAAELAAAFHAGRGDELSAHGNLRYARGAWQRWGAAAKVRQLQADHPAVFEQDAWAPAMSRLQALDAQAVLRISTALASDIVPARLVETLLRTALESAGADCGTLTLLRQGAWQVRAQAQVLNGAISVAQEPTVFGTEVLPVSIVQAVARTQQRIVVGDAREDPSLVQDDYVRRRRPRSVLCVPLMRHANLVGVLYLENNLAAHVFTLAKAEVLEVIASHAAFALENARLYEELLDQNHQRALAEEQLRGALADLERASRLKAMGELVASIVHEIGQPIAAVDTSASAALRWLDRSTPDISEAREMLIHISKSALRARNIIQSLRAKARKAEPQFATFDLNEALREAVTLVAGPLESLGIVLELQGLDSPEPVYGDRVQLQQVAVNLLMNGAESMAMLEHSTRRLLLACARDDESRVSVTVDDIGIGLGAETTDKLLQPLFSTKANGMGMGLAICKSILDAHDGTLALLPREPAGTRAVFTLPRPYSAELPSIVPPPV